MTESTTGSNELRTDSLNLRTPVEGYKVDLAVVRSGGVPLTTVDQYIEQKRDKFVID